ncbi:uncharacterized protein JN550_005056 [Neoarthrinium moseri]|uniref:uncharacterized protein n=1 Tax=Neoarthrinium moseri TaxID=1658444 RepID=UPI001FDE7576|nr:uncharacterized protein JN550_005056 [Neoarthrinium moseri]KAI1870513.1 hypothetical protein JN550_005056 [Neoarthrinium moseri]
MSKDAAGDTAAVVTHVPGSPSQGGQGIVSDRSQRTGPTQLQYNGDAPPSVAFASGNPYLDRPLPAPPQRKAKMVERPNTSGGPSSKSQTRDNNWNFDKYDKRVSRDDFYLSMKPRAGLESKPPQFPPFRSQLPTPEGSPRSQPPSQPAVPIVRLPTPDSVEESVSGPIGMALGSPSHPPTAWNTWSSQQTLQPQPARPMLPVSPLSSASSVDSYDMPKERKPSGKWKLFGMFGRKHADNSQSTVSISEPNELKGSYQQSQQTTPRSQPGRSNTDAKKVPKHKPIVIRSQTAPNEHGMRLFSSSRTRSPSIDTFGSAGPHGRAGSNFGSIPIALDSAVPSANATPNLLNVEIPQSNMERYSVMFGSVLQTQPSNSSALLARRQATLRDLRKISDAVILEEEEKQTGRPRRVSSPQHAKASPAFALFPSPPSRQSNHQQVSHQHRQPPRILRSNTSPAMLPSPSRATFEGPSSHHLNDAATANKAQFGNKVTIATLAKSREQQQAVHGFHFGAEQSGLILESPTELNAPEFPAEVIRTSTVRHKIQEPDWQIIEPAAHAAPSTASSVSSSRKRSPSSVSSAQTHMTQPSVDLDEQDTANMNPVEVSIARQISISRQQRKMLQPLQTSFTPSKPRGSPGNPSPPVPMIAIGKNERLAETKTSTPTLVTPSTFDSQLRQHRKSERIVLEG